MFCVKSFRYLIPVFALSTVAAFAESHDTCKCGCAEWKEHAQRDHGAKANGTNGTACNLDFALILHLASAHADQYPELQQLLPGVKNINIDELCSKIDCGACYNAHMKMYHSQNGK